MRIVIYNHAYASYKSIIPGCFATASRRLGKSRPRRKSSSSGAARLAEAQPLHSIAGYMPEPASHVSKEINYASSCRSMVAWTMWNCISRSTTARLRKTASMAAGSQRRTWWRSIATRSSLVATLSNTCVVLQYVMYTYMCLRQMADNAFAWAAARKLVRNNPIHGCDEARLVLEETFSLENEKGEKRDISGSAEIEASILRAQQFSARVVPEDCYLHSALNCAHRMLTESF